MIGWIERRWGATDFVGQLERYLAAVTSSDQPSVTQLARVADF